MAAPVEPKVTAASLSAAVVGLVLWALDVYVFGGEVPGPVAVFVVALGAFVAGWLQPTRGKRRRET